MEHKGYKAVLLRNALYSLDDGVRALKEYIGTDDIQSLDETHFQIQEAKRALKEFEELLREEWEG